MNERIKGELTPNPELTIKFKNLDDDGVAHSIITGELFSSGQDGEDEVNERIEKIENEAVKNLAKFRIAKLYYEVKQEIESAVKKAGEISDPNEQTRCLVHLAIAVLENEGNLALADQIIIRVKQDDEGYLKFYNKEKERITAK